MPSRTRALLERIEAAREERRLIDATAAAIASLAPQLNEPLPPVRVRLDPAIAHGLDAIIRRDGAGFEVALSSHDPHATRRYGPARLASYLYWMLHSSKRVERMSVTLSDGDRSSAATFSPSPFLADVVALPDPIFFASRGYARERTTSLNHAVPWRERAATLVWRGGMNSLQSFDPDIAMSKPALASQRLLACLMLRGVRDTDVKFPAGLWQRETGAAVYERLGVTGPRVAPETWLGQKYALDIDGYSSAWSNLFTRLLFGCCVLKVDSRYGFRQWYYDRLRPWEHYVPVAADLANLVKRFDWALSHDAQCREIAQNGRRLALELTLSAAIPEAAELIEANWRRQR